MNMMVMRSLILILLVFLFGSCKVYDQRSDEKATIKLHMISKELVTMREEDQRYRLKFVKLIKKGKVNSKRYKRTSKKLKSIDRKNTARLREIVERYGWPTYDLVGEKASNCAWLIVQHADMNPLVQMYCLPLLKEAVDKEQANPSNYAYLYDRVQIALGERQLYATQSTTNNGLKTGYFQPIEDESNVQKRRNQMEVALLGITSGSPSNSNTVEAYAEALGFKYEVPSKEEAMKKDEAWGEAYKESIDKAYQAMNIEDYSTAADHFYKALESHGYIQTEDFVGLARALSISKHKNSSSGFYYLIRAAARGWKGINVFDSHQDFKNIKLANPEGWKDLMAVVEELN